MRNTFPRPPEGMDANHHAVFAYKHPLVREAIWQVKYNRNRILTNTLGGIIAEEIVELLSENLSVQKEREILLIPIPISTTRRRERGYNQSELLARAVSEHCPGLHLLYSPNLLLKTKETHHQSKSKNRQERLKNLIDSFSVTDKDRIADKTVILIDDVITTGATMREAEKTLIKYGAKEIICIALAH